MQEFSAKRDALFACLDDASKELRGTALDQSKAKSFSINALDRGNQSGNASGSGEVMNYRHGRSIDVSPDSEDGRLRRMRGKESIFKKPELPIGRCLKPRKTPDYQVRDYFFASTTSSIKPLILLPRSTPTNGRSTPCPMWTSPIRATPPPPYLFSGKWMPSEKLMEMRVNLHIQMAK